MLLIQQRRAVPRFLLYFPMLWVALTHEDTSSTKTDYEKASFPTETSNRRTHEITPPRKSKNSQSTKTAPPPQILMIQHYLQVTA